MENRKNYTKNILIVLFAVFVGAILMYGLIYLYPQKFSTVVTKLEKDVTVNESGIADAVEKAYDAVVVVSTYKDSKLVASGTGFTYKKGDSKGYILTNNHVIAAGNKVTVKFTDGRVEETEIVGKDEYADIAVLSLDSDKIKTISHIGSSKEARIGDTVFAVGAPINNNYSWTVTRGILSGKDRMVEVSINSSSMSDYVMKVMQTDAAINSGNSGGPLCNSNGEVIGITSLKLVNTGVEGMSFAIPIEDAVSMAETLIKGGKREMPYIGVGMLDLTVAYYYRDYYSLIRDSGLTEGVLITEVEKNSAAYKAGIREDDIVIKIGEIDVPSLAYFRYALYQYKIGDKVKITYYRDGETKTTDVTLGSKKSTS